MSTFGSFEQTGRGRGKKSWFECVKRDMKDLGLCVDDVTDCELWKSNIFIKRLSRTGMESRLNTMMMMMMMLMMCACV